MSRDFKERPTVNGQNLGLENHQHDHIENLETDSRLATAPPSEYPAGLSVMRSEDDTTEDTFAWNLPPCIVETDRYGTNKAVQNVTTDIHPSLQRPLKLYRVWLTDDEVWGPWQRVNFWDDLINVPSTFTPSSFTHTQTIASTTWTVDHNLGRRPAAISILDSANNEVEGEIQHTSNDQFVASFGTAFSGEVLCT